MLYFPAHLVLIPRHLSVRVRKGVLPGSHRLLQPGKLFKSGLRVLCKLPLAVWVHRHVRGKLWLVTLTSKLQDIQQLRWKRSA